MMPQTVRAVAKVHMQPVTIEINFPSQTGHLTRGTFQKKREIKLQLRDIVGAVARALGITRRDVYSTRQFYPFSAGQVLAQRLQLIGRDDLADHLLHVWGGASR